jgi:hypothetical protein
MKKPPIQAVQEILLLGILAFCWMDRFFEILSSDLLLDCVCIWLALLAVAFVAFLAHMAGSLHQNDFI